MRMRIDVRTSSLLFVLWELLISLCLYCFCPLYPYGRNFHRVTMASFLDNINAMRRRTFRDSGLGIMVI